MSMYKELNDLDPELRQQLTKWMTNYMEKNHPKWGELGGWYLETGLKAMKELNWSEPQIVENFPAAWELAHELGREAFGEKYPYGMAD